MAPLRAVDRVEHPFYPARSQAAPSSNGKTTDSDSVNRGSNPRGASRTFNALIYNELPVTDRQPKLRLLLFAFGDFAFNLYWQSIMLFLLFYYTDAIDL